MEQQPRPACERTKLKENQNQACHIKTDHTLFCSI